jgi:hypothetical protein
LLALGSPGVQRSILDSSSQDISLYRLDASIRVEGSHSRAIADIVDRFTDLARQLRQEAEEQARHHGRELGAAVAITPPKAA